ncbi:DUF6807 family protein [Wenyingzhuangia marina]|uniref:Methane oxygenase PmoA n=1 Tax=Wenyingzhuangia marina TaxID=1195760 RepID=A0A1M5S3H6_9FLAO|nr:DUF6807 family protein [Wenyingzhuangia marina]GGF78748.1 hypothetical protein GCM10011397_22230 [Wenyingzhuangia marina]SHH33021.1 Methane oxygenase PmoA [Wenyingzhuangia marina]
MKFFYFLIYLFLITNSTFAQKIHLKINEDAAYFTEENDSILVYQIAEKSINEKYARNNYIHPLYNLNGEILTEDFPKDHLHHRGIFWAWHQLYIGNKRIGDGWELKNFSQDVISVKKNKIKGNSKSIKTMVLWKSNLWLDKNGDEKPFVKETSTITVYPKENEYRLIDIKISMIALEPNVYIGGSENAKGYGGFSARIKLSEKTKFTGHKGTVTPKNLPVTSEGWIDISENFDDINLSNGVTIISHANNPGYPNPWILRSKNSMQNAVFPGAKLIPLSETKPITLHYSLLIHKGSIQNINIEKIYKK